MHTFYNNVLIYNCNYSVFDLFRAFQGVHLQKDLYMQFCGISIMHPYKQFGQWQDVLDTHAYMFRASKWSSSGRLVHAVLWYFFHAFV